MNPPSTSELRRRLLLLAAQAGDVPPERVVQFATVLDKLERIKDDEPQLWAF